MAEVLTFWEAFEAIGRIMLMVAGGFAPILIATGLIIAALDHKKIIRWWRGRP